MYKHRMPLHFNSTIANGIPTTNGNGSIGSDHNLSTNYYYPDLINSNITSNGPNTSRNNSLVNNNISIPYSNDIHILGSMSDDHNNISSEGASAFNYQHAFNPDMASTSNSADYNNSHLVNHSASFSSGFATQPNDFVNFYNSNPSNVIPHNGIIFINSPVPKNHPNVPQIINPTYYPQSYFSHVPVNSGDSCNQPSFDHLFSGILNGLPNIDDKGQLSRMQRGSIPDHQAEVYINNLCMSPPPMPTKRTPRSSTSSSSSIGCVSGCESNASSRCMDCNEFMCNNCVIEHRKSPKFAKHSVVALPSPIGTIPSPPPAVTFSTYDIKCDTHGESVRYVCEHCQKLVCQSCTFREHKEHDYISIQCFMENIRERIKKTMNDSTSGTKHVKASIDMALSSIRLLERNCTEVIDNIRKTYRQFIMALEDRERSLIDFVEKARQRRLTHLYDQMAGLKSMVSGLAEITEILTKVNGQFEGMDPVDIALAITDTQRQMEQFASTFKDLQPRVEMYVLSPPNMALLTEIRKQGTIVIFNENVLPGDITPAISHPNMIHGDAGVNVQTLPHLQMQQLPQMYPMYQMPPIHQVINGRRPMMRDLTFRMPTRSVPPNPALEWELSLMRSSPRALQFGAPRITQCIAGSWDRVKVRCSNFVTLSFGTEGHGDGQLSRPWGICVDKLGNILVSDRRNNRVQVFGPDGMFLFKFGQKGTGNGEFDLPAGICADCDNRIIVVDKDNHRVQIFSSNGVFLSKFGTFGKEYGQFQYPWDVAVNSRRQIAITDSRNHRIQQFDSEGRFIRQFVFENMPGKSVVAPRGICYTPQGNIIVSDFDNHCLYLIDPDVNEIISSKGQEGCGPQEFNRPSGLCCDDDGRIVVADSKNQRVMVFTPYMDYLWDIEIRPSVNPQMPYTLDEKDRTCDVAIMPDGRIVFLIELSPDTKEGSSPNKLFVYAY